MDKEFQDVVAAIFPNLSKNDQVYTIQILRLTNRSKHPSLKKMESQAIIKYILVILDEFDLDLYFEREAHMPVTRIKRINPNS